MRGAPDLRAIAVLAEATSAAGTPTTLGEVCQMLLADARSGQPARRFDATASSDYLRAGGGD